MKKKSSNQYVPQKIPVHLDRERRTSWENLLKSDLQDIVADVQDVIADPDMPDEEKLAEIEDIVSPESEEEDIEEEDETD